MTNKPKGKNQNPKEDLAEQLRICQERERRAIADYQNLVRRQQEEKQVWMKLATGELVADLLTPLSHLSLAAGQLKDAGLDMVISQLWQVLTSHGLVEINPLGQEFDVAEMEAVEDKEAGMRNEEKAGQKVVKVVSKGYKLNGKVLQHAKVIVS